MFGIESTPKIFGEKVYEWLKKRILLIVNLFLPFNRMDARGLPAQRPVLFVLLLFCSDNIRLLLPFFQVKRMLVVSFIYSFCWCVGLKYICKSEENSVFNTRDTEERLYKFSDRNPCRLFKKKIT